MTDEVKIIYKRLRSGVNGEIPDDELMRKAFIANEIIELKKEKNAVILAHNYMDTALFCSIPDYVGDSLELSRKAAETDKDIIVFCGVKFMAETAKLLNPEKVVLAPSLVAGCSLAESITAEDVRWLKSQYPHVPVVTYINTYADVKAETDICCTSGNASAVVESLHCDTIIFIPDVFMAGNVARQTGKHIIVPKHPSDNKTSTDVEYVNLAGGMVVWNGRCEVHEKFTKEIIDDVRNEYKDVMILAHPECNPEVIEAVDFTGGTTSMVKFVEQTEAPYYLLLTECAMADNIAATHPDKHLLRIYRERCPHMERVTLENTLLSLKNNTYQINVSKEIEERARKAMIKMLAIG